MKRDRRGQTLGKPNRRPRGRKAGGPGARGGVSRPEPSDRGPDFPLPSPSPPTPFPTRSVPPPKLGLYTRFAPNVRRGPDLVGSLRAPPQTWPLHPVCTQCAPGARLGRLAPSPPPDQPKEGRGWRRPSWLQPGINESESGEEQKIRCAPRGLASPRPPALPARSARTHTHTHTLERAPVKSGVNQM